MHDAIARGRPSPLAPVAWVWMSQAGSIDRQRPWSRRPPRHRCRGQGRLADAPWALGEPSPDLPADSQCLGLLPSDFHDQWPWSPMRWAFVGTRRADLVPRCWYGSRAEVALTLAGACSVQTWADPHVDSWPPAYVTRHASPSLFARVERPCASFSQWWTHATRGMKSLHELPGLAAWLSREPARPLFTQSEQT